MRSLKAKRLSLAAALAFAIGSLPLPGSAQTPQKYGFVNISQVISQSDEGQAEAEELESLGAEKEQELNARRQELEELAREYEQTVQSGSPDNALRDRIEKLKRELERDVQQARSDVDVSRKDRIERIGVKAVKVIQQFAEENGYTAVFRIDSGQVVYVDPSVNITDQIITAYNEAHPAE